MTKIEQLEDELEKTKQHFYKVYKMNVRAGNRLGAQMQELREQLIEAYLLGDEDDQA